MRCLMNDERNDPNLVSEKELDRMLARARMLPHIASGILLLTLVVGIAAAVHVSNPPTPLIRIVEVMGGAAIFNLYICIRIFRHSRKSVKELERIVEKIKKQGPV